MGAIASQITSLTIVCSTVYSGADQSKHQSSASLAFVLGNSPGPVNSPHKWPVTRKVFPFDDVIMNNIADDNIMIDMKVMVTSWYRKSFPHSWPFVKQPPVISRFHSQMGCNEELWSFIWPLSWTSCCTNSWFVGDLRHHDPNVTSLSCIFTARHPMGLGDKGSTVVHWKHNNAKQSSLIWALARSTGPLFTER